MVEIGAALGLFVGILVTVRLLMVSRARTAEAEQALMPASGAFQQLLEERFSRWGLTPAERDVALFVIKGCSTQEVADLRNTSLGTVKAQTNAIYGKKAVWPIARSSSRSLLRN
ncbi:MAG: helix-turn-helix transcriptional regulator [Rhodobacteraceae bacterium]|nr:helix-turn-helix transcriptional regulator [Paracoccaceae bacterium]